MTTPSSPPPAAGLTPEREAEIRTRHTQAQAALDEQPLARAVSSPFGLAAHDDRGVLLAALDAARRERDEARRYQAEYAEAMAAARASTEVLRQRASRAESALAAERARGEKLAGALRCYGDHRPTCQKRRPGPGADACTCGWPDHAQLLYPEGSAQALAAAGPAGVGEHEALVARLVAAFDRPGLKHRRSGFAGSPCADICQACAMAAARPATPEGRDGG